MSNILQFDPREGFVALPVGVFDIEMSPGAFRTLTELCRMANREGFCWPSLEQLSARLSRSKSAISGYVKELKATGLIDTIHQKMANGYNYRLKFLVTFWAEWRASLAGPRRANNASTATVSATEDERSVRQVERRINSKNQIQKNHIRPPLRDGGVMQEIVNEWTRLTRGVPFGSYAAPVPDSLIRSSRQAVRGRNEDHEKPLISADMERCLHEMWQKRNISLDAATLREQVQTLALLGFTACEMDTLADLVVKAWKPHWKLPPTQAQFRTFAAEARSCHPGRAQIRLIEGYLSRWEKTRNRLQTAALSSNLAA